MGSRNSTRREQNAAAMEDDAEGSDTPPPGSAQNPDGNHGNDTASDRDDDSQSDLATILSYLIRSGQVRILSSGSSGYYEDDDEWVDDDSDGGIRPNKPPPVDQNPDTRILQGSSLGQEVGMLSGRLHPDVVSGSRHACCQTAKQRSVNNLLQRREAGLCGTQNFSPAVCSYVNSMYLPNKMDVVARYQQKVFCGTFSRSGDLFLSACQDRHIRIYDTHSGEFRLIKSIPARDVGWSILDMAFSPDGNYLIYSSWADCIHLCNIHGDYETHNALHLFPETIHSFCIFSLAFSADNREIMGGANDGCLYVFDREKNERTLKINCHEDDVNAVAFADDSSHILFSGGDDGLCKVWDRRCMREEDAEPVGVLAGHTDGITFIDSKGDGHHLISNCKDQTIKLWDIRRFSPAAAQEATRRAVSKQNWDYRLQQVPKKAMKKKQNRVEGDTSLMTYRGHCVLNTLLRCRFSPVATTGQRYIYAGCATGAIVIYDLLTGKIVKRLTQHRACVRDVSWHPYKSQLISSSWDGTLGRWSYCGAMDDPDNRSPCSGSDDEQSRLRRSPRLRGQRDGSGPSRIDIRL